MVLENEHLETHTASEHLAEKVISRKWYNWVLLRQGLGHIEMNMCKAVFKLMWVPVLRHVANIMGFKSPRTMMFIQGCGDNHLAWQLIRIVLETITKELMVPYVRCRMKMKKEITVGDYKVWMDSATNSNYQLYQKFVNILITLSQMSAGIRRNNCRSMLAGRQRVAPIMFLGSGHHIYQRLLLRDMISREEQPPAVRQYVEKTTSYSVSATTRDTKEETSCWGHKTNSPSRRSRLV